MGKGGSKHAKTGEDSADLDPEALIASVPDDLKEKFNHLYSGFKADYGDLEQQFDRYRVDSGRRQNLCFQPKPTN